MSVVSPIQADSAESVRAARLLIIAGFVSVAAGVVAMLALHLSADFNPLDTVISGYLFAPHGWLLPLALLLLSTGSVAFLLVLRALRTPGWLTGLLLVWSVSLLFVAIFPTDRPGEPLSLTGEIHRYAAFVAFAAMGTLSVTFGRRFKRHTEWAASAATVGRLGIVAVGSLIAVSLPYVATWITGEELQMFPRGLTQRMTVGAEIVVLALIGMWARDRLLRAVPAVTVGGRYDQNSDESIWIGSEAGGADVVSTSPPVRAGGRGAVRAGAR